MTLLWITLFLLHRGHSLVPVVTVKLGEPVTFTCVFKKTFKSTTWLHWYKQRAGNTLKIILTERDSVPLIYGPGFSAETISAKHDENMSNLTILRTTEEDEGFYHCAYIDWTECTWSGTYLSIKGNTQRTLNYTVVQRPTAPYRPADSRTLQCSVLSESENQTCSEDLSVFWFRAKSDKSYPDIMHIDGNRPEKCEKTSGPQRRCFYNVSKNMDSSDDETYYCAVATCGQIIIEKQLTLQTNSQETVLLVIMICLVLSMVVNIILISYLIQRSTCKQQKGAETSSSHEKQNIVSQTEDETEDRQDLNYAALHFSQEKTRRGKKKTELKTEESVYSQVKRSV